MRWRFVFVVVFVLLVFLGKFLPVPFAVMMIASKSMEPSLRVGDFVVVFGKDVHVGDVVVWCATPLYCIAHRVVNVTSTYIITKGDANFIPDNPVPLSAVKGRVVFVVPRELWVSVLFVGIVVFSFRRRRSIINFLRSSRDESVMSFVVLSSYLLVSSFILLLSSNMLSVSVAPIRQPVVYLSRTFFDGGVYVSYVGEGLSLQSIDGCVIKEPVHEVCRSVLLNGSLVYVPVSDDVLRMVNVKGSPIVLSLNGSLYPGGRFYGSYEVYLPFNDLEVRVLNGSLRVVNRNYFPVVVNVTWLWADVPGSSWNVFRASYVVSANGSLNVDAPKHRYVFVDVEYIMGGVVRKLRLQVF